MSLFHWTLPFLAIAATTASPVTTNPNDLPPEVKATLKKEQDKKVIAAHSSNDKLDLYDRNKRRLENRRSYMRAERRRSRQRRNGYYDRYDYSKNPPPYRYPGQARGYDEDDYNYYEYQERRRQWPE